MKKFQLLALFLAVFSIRELPAMESDDSPPPAPPRTWTSKPLPPTPTRPSKPLPPAPGKQPIPAAASSEPAVIPAYFQEIPPTTASAPTETVATNVTSEPSLTDAQEHSIQKIEEDINKLMENNVSIAKHGIELGKSASSSSFLTLGKESAKIVAKLGSSSLLVANIYKHAERLSNASPEVQAVARKRILAIVNSPAFKQSEADLIRLAADDSLPKIVREPLQKLARQIAELPGIIVTKYLNK